MKVSCEVGRFGACMVLMDGESVNSCLVMAYQCAGSECDLPHDHGRNEVRAFSEFQYHKRFYRSTYSLGVGLCCSMKHLTKRMDTGTLRTCSLLYFSFVHMLLIINVL